MKTETLSWRLSKELKADLEAEARRRKVSLGALLETLAREGLADRKPSGEASAQTRLHTAAAKFIGALPEGRG